VVWWAPPLDRSSPAPVPWTEESLFNYLRSWDSVHGGGVGPMKPVVEGLAQLPEADVRAIATYVASFLGGEATPRQARIEAIAARPGPATSDPARSDPAVERGALVFKGACASCHESGGTVPFTVASLAQHTALAAPDPRNVIHVVLGGITPAEGEVGGIMPAFQGTLTEAQITDLLTYLRARFTDEPAWPKVGDEVHRLAQADRPR
jgi:mono/diheme cytochrome c family protein